MARENSIYFHINNGGVEFEVVDDGRGPMVRVSASHFGHPTASTGVYVTREALSALSAFFAEQAGREFSPDYCVASEPWKPSQRVSGDVQGAGSVG